MNNIEKNLSEELSNTQFAYYKFITIETVKDSSGLLYAILFALNQDKFQSKNSYDQKEYVKQVREKIAKIYFEIDNNKIPDPLKKLYDTVILNYKNNTSISIDERKYKNRDVIQNYNTTIGIDMVPLFEYIFDTRIVFVDIDKNKYVSKGFVCSRQDSSNFTKTIFIKIKNNYYEPFVIKDPINRTYTSTFDSNSSIVDSLVKFCNNSSNRLSLNTFRSSSSTSGTSTYTPSTYTPLSDFNLNKFYEKYENSVVKTTNTQYNITTFLIFIITVFITIVLAFL